MFNVGQKVVLVDDQWPETVKQLYLQLPLLDNVYVVRAVRVGVKADELIMDMRRVLEPSLLLVGLYNPANNLGVEAGQILVLALVLPILFWLRRHAWFARQGVRSASTLIAIAGLVWFFQRVGWGV